MPGVLNDSEHDESDSLAGAQTSRNDIDLRRRRHERQGADEEASIPTTFGDDLLLEAQEPNTK